MEIKVSFWSIYASNYYKKNRMLLLMAGIVLWFALILVQVFVTELQLSNWFMAPFPLLAVELAYVLNCYRKYTAQE